MLLLCAALCLAQPSCKSSSKMADTRNNALEWNGAYNGITPCADCQGILTTLVLNQRNTYTLHTKYLGKTDQVHTSSGTFGWHKDGNTITLNNGEKETVSKHFRIGENAVTQLDIKGKLITGNLAPLYVLRKTGNDITNTYWKLIEVRGQGVPPDSTWRREPHLILHPTGNRVTGHGGCNNFAGTYTVEPNSGIRFSQMAVTRMACPNLDIETALLQVLEQADGYIRTGDSLQLIKARMSPLARFVAVYLR